MSDDKSGQQSASANPNPTEQAPKVLPFISAPSEGYDRHSKLVRYWLDQRIARSIGACLRQLQLIADANVREQIILSQQAIRTAAELAAESARAAGNEEEAKSHLEAAKVAADAIESKADPIEILTHMGAILLHCATSATAKGYRELIRQALPTYNGDFVEKTLTASAAADPSLAEFAQERSMYEKSITPRAWMKLLNSRYYMVEKLGGTNMVVPKYRTVTHMDLTPLTVPNFEHAGDDEQVFLGFRTIKGRKGGPDREEPHFENPRAWWRRQSEAEKYDYQVFKPGERTGGTRGGPYNTWTGWPIAVDKEMYVRAPGSKHGMQSRLCGDRLTAQWSTIADYVFRVLSASDGDIFKYLCYHTADAIQNPQSSDNIGVIFRGGTGVGKTKVVRLLRRFWGKPYIAYIRDIADLTGDFTGILQNKVAIFADDVFSAKDKRTEKILLALANSDEQRVRLMRTDTFYQEKYSRLYIADNESWVAPIALDDRRFTMLDVSPCEKENHEYFRRLDAAIDGDEGAAFFNFLMTLDLSHVNLRRDRPVTRALIEQMQHSLRGEARAIENILQTGEIPIYLRGGGAESGGGEVDAVITNGTFGSEKFGQLQVPGDCETIFCFTSRVYDYYRGRGYHFQSQTAFSSELKKLALDGVSVQRKFGVGTNAPNWRGVSLPPVTVCRRLFEIVWNKGRKWNWKEAAVEWANVAFEVEE